MLQPQTIEIETDSGAKKEYILSKFNCIEGREILTQYPLTGTPKLGAYADNEKLMLRVLAHVGVPTPGGQPLKLSSRALITNHVPDATTLLKLEYEMFKFNFSFFRDGGLFEVLRILLEQIKPALTQTLTPSLESSLVAGSPPSTS